MTLSLILSGIIAPAIFWIAYLYYKDRFKPEPLFHIGLTYILGFISAYVCLKSYGLLSMIGLPEDSSVIRLLPGACGTTGGIHQIPPLSLYYFLF